MINLSIGLNFTSRPVLKGMPQREPLAVGRVPRSLLPGISFQILINENRYRFVHSLDMLVVRNSFHCKYDDDDDNML